LTGFVRLPSVNRTKLLATLCVMLTLSCAPAPAPAGPGSSAAPLGTDFSVPLRQTRAVADLQVGFDSVVADSRCKPGRECFWAGDAEVAVSVTDSGGAHAVVRLHSNSQFPRTADHAGYRVELMDVAAQGDVITLRVSPT
jgi:hypothetical protein